MKIKQLTIEEVRERIAKNDINGIFIISSTPRIWNLSELSIKEFVNFCEPDKNFAFVEFEFVKEKKK